MFEGNPVAPFHCAPGLHLVQNNSRNGAQRNDGITSTHRHYGEYAFIPAFIE
jgi:hypothetical protein